MTARCSAEGGIGNLPAGVASVLEASAAAAGAAAASVLGASAGLSAGFSALVFLDLLKTFLNLAFKLSRASFAVMD